MSRAGRGGRPRLAAASGWPSVTARGPWPSPGRCIERGGDPAADRRAVAEVVAEEGAGVLVVGLPLSLDGRHGPAAREAEAEAEALAVVLEGKRGGGGDVRRAADHGVGHGGAVRRRASAARTRRRSVDSAAATVLLQAWLDAR